MKLTKRKTVRTISFLCAITLTLAVWGTVNAVALRSAERSITQSNERALTQLGTYLDDITLNLQKSMYLRGGDKLSEITSDLWRSSVSAKENLSEITDGNTEISGVYKFLSQVGEYTLYVNKELARGNSISEEQSENLNKLLEYSRDMSNRVNYLIQQEENGLLSFREIKSTLQSSGDSGVYLGSELNDANQSLVDYPTLIYDGPFSDHIQNKKSQLLEGQKEVTEEEAREKAAGFLGLKPEQIAFLSRTEGNLSTYTFYNGDYTVAVTKKGGIVSFMLSSFYANEIKLTPQQAIKKATQYLKEKGYTSVRDSYYSTVDGICTVNFAYFEDGITYYTDLIKVSVALDDGRITAFDSTGYLMNHRVRTVPQTVKLTPVRGKRLLKSDLEIISYKKAFIPTEWESEVYAYEYRCVSKSNPSQEVLVYIDPVTGQECDVLLLMYSDGGVLTK
ncbi:MAG: germination protein YpeB [Clostridia bacterium]|nr:germination protein YpeB [Clostridia bacterium]